MTVNEYRALVSGLDGLPLVQVHPVSLPDGHPDLDTFDADMAALAKAARWIWARSLWGKDEMRANEVWPTVESDVLHTYTNTPGVEVLLHIAIDMAAFECIADDIAKVAA